EIKELEGKVGKIGKLRQGAIAARGKAIQVVQAAAKKLGATPIGRVLSRAAAEALGLALKRFLPIYNSIQLAKDLYTVGSFLVNADWSKLADGRAGAGSGDQDDSGTGDGTGKAAADGDGDGDGGGSEEITTDDLAAPAPAELDPVAERIVGSLIKSGAGKGQTLDADAKELINRVVPSDLSREELEIIAKRLQNRSSDITSRPLPEAVIEAIQHVRPDGKPRPLTAPSTSTSSSTSPTPALEPAAPIPSRPRVEPQRTSPPATAQRTPAPSPPGSRIIDVRGYLIENTTVDPVSGKVVVPAEFTLGGVMFSTTVEQSRALAMDDYYTVRVTLVPTTQPSRALITTGKIRLHVDAPFTEVFDVALSKTGTGQR
ncbi:MAG: hypothetical protein H0X17_24775, partial [Deltaproteobacteria bacterium]|nr:hypothetical protein [Deltaproteobacteria bacterium]